MGAIAASTGSRAEVAESVFWASYARNIPTTGDTRDTGAVPVAGGYALCVQGTWLDYALAAGRMLPLRADDLQTLDGFYTSRGLVPQAELHPTVAERDADLLTAWGYAPVRTVAVLERDIAAGLPEPALTVESMDGRRSEWTELLVAAFADATAPSEADRLRRSLAASIAAGAQLFAARVDGRLVGGASLGMYGDVGFLMGAATLANFRNRGVHEALIAARLRAAEARGATYAFLKTDPDSTSMRSAERAGFTRAYDRVRMRKG